MVTLVSAAVFSFKFMPIFHRVLPFICRVFLLFVLTLVFAAILSFRFMLVFHHVMPFTCRMFQLFLILTLIKIHTLALSPSASETLSISVL